MTHIVSPTRYASKKAFKIAVEADATRVYVDDPSMFNPVSGSVSEVVAQKGSFTVTNHPKRSWFAEVTRKGEKIVVK